VQFGASIIGIEAENAGPGTILVLADTPLNTARANERELSAEVPPSLYAQPGRFDAYLKYGDQESNRLEFVVE
jgi:hypothetical protein